MKNRVAIPSGLINALWCCWKYEDRDGRRTKVPINPRTGYRAKSNDLNTFTDDYQKADDARTVVGYDGVGLGLFNGLCAIDIDHCVSVAEDGTIQLSDVAKDIIERMNSYTELSPSGTGVHILFRAPGLPWDTKRYYVKNPNNGVEIYIAEQTNRFMTFTGAALFSDCDIEERSTAVLEVAERYMMRKNQSEAPASTPQNEAVNRTPLDDDELIRIARSAKNGNVFSALWDGNISGYQSQSEADLALCNLLAFYTGKDPEQMDRLFRRSGLMRDKWDRATGGSTYGAYTIQRAIDDCRTVYTQGRGRATLKPPDLSDSGNAQVFVEMYRGSLIYTDALGWLWWNGQQWERNDHKAMNCAGELSERMLKDAQRANREALAAQADAKATVDETEDAEDKSHFDDTKAEVKKAAAYLKHANNLRSARCLKNMLELAKHDLVVKADALDANPFDLNTPAGIVDLKTGELRPHDPDAYCSQITEASPDNKGAEMWQDFLHTITENDSDVERFLQAAAGMSLIGEVYHEGIIIAYGGGRNGKSTYFNALGRVLGGLLRWH